MAGLGKLAEAVRTSDFIFTAECKVPRGMDSSAVKSYAAALAGSVNAISAPESEEGVCLCSLAAARHILDSGCDPMMQVLTRDMNRIALQSAALGAASMGIKNILCSAGRHQTLTSCSSAKGVFDVDPVQLLRMLDSMRRDGQLPDMLLGTDTNPFAEPVELNVLGLEAAVDAGAGLVITQPVFDLPRFDEWMGMLREKEIHTRAAIIASVMPITVAMNTTSPLGWERRFFVPDEVLDELQESGDKSATSARIAEETIKRLRRMSGVRGIHLMVDGDSSLALEILKTVKD